ncbi:MAG: efflux RND transporter periplasmic adaptor subunit [Pseudomonadota bacterium]
MLRALFFVVSVIVSTAANGQSVTAILEPVNSVEIKPSVNGRIAEILVREGDVVKRDAVLANIDARVQRARVALAEIAADADGAVMRAEIVKAQAEALRDRVARARSKGAAQAWEVTQSEQAVQLAEADLIVAREGVLRNQSQLDLDRAILSEFTMIAPFNGTILEVMTQPGEVVETENVVLEIGNMERLRATAFVPLDWLSALAQGEEIEATQTDGTTIIGTVTSIDPRVDPASLSVRVRLSFNNSDLTLLAGTAISVTKP